MNKVLREKDNYEDKINREALMDIEGNFSDYDRIFFLRNDLCDQSLLLFSEKRQAFVKLGLENRKISTLSINAGCEYQQVELYDGKLFCINMESLTMEVFFSSKKQLFFHKKIFYFGNKNLRLKEKFRFVIWEHHHSGILYQCLLGPLEDGRYMNFYLFERYFDYTTDTNLVIEKMMLISLKLDTDQEKQRDIICAMDEAQKSMICFDKEEHGFFEYNNFCDSKSKSLQLVNDLKVEKIKIKRMYFYYPYDFLSQKEKNKLMAKMRNIGNRTDLEDFIRNGYKEVLLCMEGSILLKMYLVDEAVQASVDDGVWKIDQVVVNRTFFPIDIAINKDTGEIYCLCEQEIIILQNSSRRPEILLQNKSLLKSNYYNTGFLS